MEIPMMIFKIYAATVAITLATEGLVQLRADINRLGMGKGQLIITLVVSIMPIGNIIIILENISLLLSNRVNFIIRYISSKARENEFEIVMDGDNCKIYRLEDKDEC